MKTKPTRKTLQELIDATPWEQAVADMGWVTALPVGRECPNPGWDDAVKSEGHELSLDTDPRKSTVMQG